MTRKPALPKQLLDAPFTIDEARAAGLTWNQLRSGHWRRLAPAMYAWVGIPDTPWLRLAALARRLPSTAIFTGRTSLWLHDVPIDPMPPIQLLLPRGGGIQRMNAVTVWRADVEPDDVTVRLGYQTTLAPRALGDLAYHSQEGETVALLDAALHAGAVTAREVGDWIDRNRGRKGTGRLRRALALADPNAESPMETRLRLLLVNAGLGHPKSQVNLYDRTGGFIGRVDLYYEAARLVLEYDGATHRDRLAEDNRRQNRLVTAGYSVLRFTASDVLGRPDFVIAHVATALHRAA